MMLLGFLSRTIDQVHADEAKQENYYAIMFLVDALHPHLFEQMIKEGDLPNIKEYIYDSCENR